MQNVVRRPYPQSEEDWWLFFALLGLAFGAVAFYVLYCVVKVTWGHLRGKKKDGLSTVKKITKEIKKKK